VKFCRFPSLVVIVALMISAAFLIALPALCAAQESLPLAHHVSANVPVQGSASTRTLSAERPFTPQVATPSPLLESPAAHSWQLQATLPGTVIHDLSFASPLIGYAAAELGQVWKTTDGGKSWTEILNLGGPYYFYGVSALTAKDVVISGFYDSSSFEGLIRWSHDGGLTWSNDIVLTSTGWLQRVRFPNSNDGLIMDLIGGSSGNTAQFTTDGGALATDWTTVVDNPAGNWFGLQFSLLPNLHARASGINFCISPHGGNKWSCGPSVDSVFDGPVFFLNDGYGWVGGGEISPNVEGWVHVTTNGGKTWSGRTLDGPWPIRQLLFLTPKAGWAAGGNLYTGVGGIYFSEDGGQTWSVDVTTNAEMDACDKQPLTTGYRVWCAGYDSSLNGVIYSVAIK
jgi:photosystem II stability/assembly factor-like uncharacterized protein